MSRGATVLVACTLALRAATATAQSATSAPVAWQPPPATDSTQARSMAPGWLRPVASTVLPGSGQLIAGQDRGVLYLAAEIFLLTRYFIARGEGRRERDRFRDLAFTVARAPFTPTVRDTVFEYFEQLAAFVESGPLDVDPGPGFVPPTDEETYNGQVWALARATFFTDPDVPPDPESEEFLRALSFYRSRAVGPNFAWSWRNAGLEQDLFRRSIRHSDAAFRRATQQLGLMLVNHLISSVDAYISQRLSRRGRTATVSSLIWNVPGARNGFSAGINVRITY